MPENDGGSLGVIRQRKAKMSLIEILVFALYATGLIGLQAISAFGMANSGTRKPLLGILALLCIFFSVSGTVLLALKAGRSPKRAYLHFNTVGFWMMAAAYIVALCDAVAIALFTTVLPLPPSISASFMSNLTWVGLGAGIAALVRCTVWLMEAGLKTRRNFRRWLDTLDADELQDR